MGLGEVEPEQVGKILDRRLCARWISSRQRRDGVHIADGVATPCIDPHAPA